MTRIMKPNSNSKRFFATLVALVLPVLLLGQTQYDYYDDGAVAGGVDRALKGIIIIGGIIAVVIVLALILYVVAKVYLWFNPVANPEHKRTMAATEKEREMTVGKGNTKEKDNLSVTSNEEKPISKNADTVESEVVNPAFPVSRLSNDELEYIKSIINPSKEETEKTKVDLSCRYGFASYTQDYKKLVRLSFSYCYIEEGTKAILKVLDGTETICSNAINSDYQQQVILPDSLLYIGDNSIKCKSLKEIFLPQSLKFIGDFAFYGCKNLQKITIPYGVRHIGVAAFSNTGIKEIVCNSPVFSIIDHCLYDDGEHRIIKYFGSADKVIVPSNVIDITGAFAGCKNIEHVTLPQGLVSIGERTFMNCDNLKEVVFESSIVEIGWCAFSGCKNLEKVVIPEGVKTIRDMCFEGCQNLRYVVLPNTIEVIDGDIFGMYSYTGKCISLKHIFIPVGTKEKFMQFFPEELLKEGNPEEYYEKENQEHLYIPNSELKTTISEQDIRDGWTDEFGYRYSADGRRLLSKTGFTQVVNEYRVKESTVIICDGVFKDSSLEIINLPDSVIKIGDGAFSGCKKLKRINIPSTISYFGERVFSGCSSLQSISLPSSLEMIRKYMFNGCSSLKEINIPLGVKEIHERVFYNCSSLKELIIPEGVEFIGDNAFGGCSKVQEFTLPTTLREIEGNPFGNTISSIGEKQFSVTCKSPLFSNENGALYNIDKKTLVSCLSGETKFEVVEGTIKIGDGAFYGNSCLESIVLPSTIVEIGNNAFYGCYFTRILLPDSIKRIGDFAFGNCEFLSKIVIPKGLEFLGKEAFWGCKRITELVLPKTLRQIEKQSFGSCESMKSITILNPNIIIDDEAFSFSEVQQIEFAGIPSAVNGDPFCWTDNLKEIFVPWGTKKHFCSLFPSKKDIIKTKSKAKDANKQEQLDLSTEITEQYKAEIEACKDDSDFIYSKDGRKLLSCERKETLDEPMPFEDEYGRRVLIYNNRIMGYDEYNSRMDLWNDEFYYEVTPGTQIICDKAFSRCESLGEIRIPESVKAIGIRAFEDCKSLKRFTFPSEIKVVKENCFIACTSLISVKLPDSLEIIEKGAFGACNKLNKIEFPETVKTIGFAAFQGCPLEEINLPKNLEEIEAMAFCYTKIKELKIPKEVKVIGRKAFLDCFNLRQIEFEGVDVECDNAAFVISTDAEGHYRKMQLDTIYVPNGTKSIFASKFPDYQEIIIER